MVKPPSTRSVLIGSLVLLLSGIVLVELLLLYSRPTNWMLPDYNNLLSWGRAAREGTFYYLYPAPVLFWVAVPLSLLPGWFSLVWLAGPFAVLLYHFRQKAFVVWLFFPVLLQAATGQLDGWFLQPLFWIFADTPLLNAVSCALLTLKPQLAILVVPFAVAKWLMRKDWKPLLQFVGTILILYLPTFVIDPTWPLKMIPAMQSRASEFLLPTRGASFWWWPRNTALEIAALTIAIALVAVLFLRAVRREENQRKAIFLSSLLVVPAFYAVSYITVVATLRGSTRELIALTLVSWSAFVVDYALGGWGGAYALIPITALWFLSRASQDTASLASEPPTSAQSLRTRTRTR